MDQAARHYSQLLARHYTWMSGLSVAAKAKEQRALLEALGVTHGSKCLAVDLGCGTGFQAFALAELGFAEVLAIDTSQMLLQELSSIRKHYPITTRCADLREFSAFVDPGSVDLITCMGDTLTLLEAHSDVPQLFRDARIALAESGKLVLTFRDLSQERVGTDRFLPIRSDADRIMTCVLDYEPTTVRVTDLIHCRNGHDWTLHKAAIKSFGSALPRLRPVSPVSASPSNAAARPAACTRSSHGNRGRRAIEFPLFSRGPKRVMPMLQHPKIGRRSAPTAIVTHS